MAAIRWQAIHEVVETTFHMLLSVFVVILFIDKFTQGLIRFKYINLDYALVAVLVFGALVIPLQFLTMNASSSNSE